MRFYIALTPVEEKMLRELEEEFGYHTHADVLRDALRLLYQEKMPPAYSRKIPKDKTPKSAEQWCKEQGGTIIIKGNEKFCRIMEGSMEVEKIVPKEFV